MVIINWKALNRVKNNIVTHLKLYFSNSDNYREFFPDRTIDFSGIEIYMSEPLELTSFPCIILSSSSGEMQTAGLGDMAFEVYDEQTNELIGYKYGGMFDFSINVEIGCKSTPERDILSDIVAKALRFDVRRSIQEDGIIIKSMRYSGESVIQYASNHIYISTINLSTWSEWYEFVDIMKTTGINVNVNLKK